MNAKTDIKSAKKEVANNYKYFQKMLPEWRDEHLAEYALIHNQKLVDFFKNDQDAIRIGIKNHGLGHFSVQAVQNASADLGHQSNALF